MGIIRQRLHLFPADRPIPPVIYQYIFISHCSCQIDVPHLILIIDTSILPQNPAPGSTPETIIVNRFVKWLHDVPNDRRFHNRLQIIPYSNGTPGSCTGQSQSRGYRSIPIILFGHRKIKDI